MPLSVADIFSGAGGLTLGFKRAGFRVVAALDRDDYAKETYTRNNPDVAFLHRSVRTVSGKVILKAAKTRKLDMVVGGPPCRPYSKANRKRNGSSHPDHDAVHHFLRLIGEMRPRCFLMENVEVLKYINGGRTFERICDKATELGYEAQTIVLDANQVGVPQHRRRLFLIGVAGQDPEITIPNGEESLGVSTAISDLPPLPEGGGGAIESEYDRPPRTQYQKRLRGFCQILLNHMSTLSGPIAVARFEYIQPKGSLRTAWGRLPRTLKEGISSIENVHTNIYRRLPWSDPSYTIVHVRKAVLIHPKQNRLISAREAARLQSFPDRYRFFGGIDAQYQQIADATPPLVALEIARQIRRALEE